MASAAATAAGEDYDLVIIGGGSGGSALSKRAAGYGAKVAIIDRGVRYDGKERIGAGPGGTCVNVGCVPKKVMFMAASINETLGDEVGIAEGFGYTLKKDALSFDWGTLKKRRDAYVRRLSEGYVNGWKKANVEVIHGFATFGNVIHDEEEKKHFFPAFGGKKKTPTPPKYEIVVKGADETRRTLVAKKVAIAVGGKISMPSIPGIEYAINSDSFFDLERQPKKAAVVGAGYIAVEMAGILHALGSETHLFFRGDTVLRRGFDPFIVDQLMQAMEAHGPELHAKSTVEAIEKTDGDLYSVITGDGTRMDGFDCILVAIGREPLGKTLKPPPGLAFDESGYVVVDEYENTTLPNVYAIGDVTTSGYELTPVAIAAGRRLADRLFGGEPRARLEYYDVATVVFSHPPIGTVGLTEPEAQKLYGKVKVKQSAFGSMMFAFNENDRKVKTGLKLVLAGPEETVVGLHCIGPLSDEMIQGFAVAVRMGATRRDFEASVAIHPTIAEELVTFAGWGTKDGKVWLPPYLDPKPNVIVTKANLLSLATGLAAGLLAAIVLMKK
eukprot:CAMPEP_0118907848 /NCGR_PEP_ID=MMETSP1166-20130328/11113_1 /TAXON_ID=1104430 /ORGANISM="Chrysoreinhardia sp, Strain CCMP3193" /LENGTH=554 /DNA_ID=CAMNT_0006847225 /DNA_START=27 /DNA_END=1691 /DNA_ORIENTATION=+